MMRQNRYRLVRYFVVGLLVTGMAVDSAAARRLFRRRARCKCPTACVDVCPPACPAPSSDVPCVVPCDCLDGAIVADSPCAAAETSIADAACQDCAAESQQLDPVPEPITEERSAPPVAPVEPSQPEVDYAPTEATPIPVEPVSQPDAIPPAPVAVPEISETEAPLPIVPQTVTPAIVEQPAAAAVGDRYSNNEDLFAPIETEDSTTPEPAVEPAVSTEETSTDEADDLFDEPAVSAEEEEPAEAPLPEPTQVEPPAEDPVPQPELDEDDLFGPSESDEPEETNEQPQVPEEPAPVESTPADSDKSYDPFADDSTNFKTDFKKRTSTLNEAGGLQSKTERTWTDNSAAFECRARLVRVTTKNVVLQKSTGANLVVPFARLADNDLQFVHQQITTLRVVRAREAAAEKLAVAWAR